MNPLEEMVVKLVVNGIQLEQNVARLQKENDDLKRALAEASAAKAKSK